MPAQNHKPGAIAHILGWPLDDKTGGGSFLYQLDDGLISIGTVVHLNYRNPTLSPFDEFQRFKTHPHVAAILRGGKRLVLWRARDHRRRLASGAEACLSRRRAHRLRRGLRQSAAQQGLA